MTRLNHLAESQGLIDLKSQTLCLLLEQMGLAQPTRHVFALRQWDPIFLWRSDEASWPEGTIPNHIIERNFDPFTLSPSHYVNDSFYTGQVYAWGPVVTPYPHRADVLELLVDPTADSYTAVADCDLTAGASYMGLTRDDVGGLRYLLKTNNGNVETLLPSVHGVGTNASNYVNEAIRPGVDKITFVPHSYDPLLGQVLPITNQFIDTYITNNTAMHQEVERVINQPDFLFCAADIRADFPSVPWFFRTGTTNWINNAGLNGDPTKAGPGLIQPPIRISFNKLGTVFISDGETGGDDLAFEFGTRWGSFDGSTNPPIRYPVVRDGAVESTARLWLIMGSSANPTNRIEHQFEWQVSDSFGTPFLFQASTNLAHWTSLWTLTNDGSVFTYFHRYPASKHRFYRVLPE